MMRSSPITRYDGWTYESISQEAPAFSKALVRSHDPALSTSFVECSLVMLSDFGKTDVVVAR